MYADNLLVTSPNQSANFTTNTKLNIISLS
jgi:Eukaryotic aspartyl protease